MKILRKTVGAKSAAVVILTFATALLVASCGGNANSTSPTNGNTNTGSTSESAEPSSDVPTDKLKIAFVYLGKIDPAESWNDAHHIVQVAMEEELGDQVEITAVEGVPEGPGSLKAFEDLARQGFDMIFGTTFGYMEQMLEVAGKYPDVKFLNAAGYLTAENMTAYFGAEEQARYLSGIIAGGMSKSGKIGYVGAFPIPLVIRGLNAFTLGAQTVNPNATVTVVWTSSWFDPTAEKQAAAALLKTGIDVISNETDSPGPGQAAEEAGAYWLGSYSDQSAFAPNAWLAAQCWDFKPYLFEQVQKTIDKTWKSENYFGTLANGMVKLCGPSDKVPADLAARVEEARAAIADDSLDIWAGPVFDQAGTEMVPSGGTFTTEDPESMTWLVKGITGKVQ